MSKEAIANYRKLRSIADSVVIITGAANGIGRATAWLMGVEGARLCLVDRDQEALSSLADELQAEGIDCFSIVADITLADKQKLIIEQTSERLGGIDVLVNNAGAVGGGPFESPECESSWDNTFAVNLTACAQLIRLALPCLRRAAYPRIINVASTEALGASRWTSPYTASKHGIAGLTKALAVEYGREGMTVNAICPGPVHSKMTSVIEDSKKAAFAKRKVPIGRYADPSEIAYMIVNLSLPAASYVNGAIIPVDGGLSINFGT